MSFSDDDVDDDGADYDDEPCAVDSDGYEAYSLQEPVWKEFHSRTDFDHAHIGSIYTIRDLIASGFDINQRDPNGRTLLHLAAIENNTCRVVELLAMNADPLILDNGGKSAKDLSGRHDGQYKIQADLSEAMDKWDRRAHDRNLGYGW